MKSFVNISIHRNSTLKSFNLIFQDSLSLFNLIIRSPLFKEAISTFKFDWRNVPYQISDDKVFDTLFLYASEHKMEIHVRKSIGKFGTFSRDILGTTIVGTHVTTVNEYWLRSLSLDSFETVIEVAAHLAHEYCHQRGFYDGMHKGQVNVVPYFIGDLVFDLANDFKVSTNIYKY